MSHCYDSTPPARAEQPRRARPAHRTYPTHRGEKVAPGKVRRTYPMSSGEKGAGGQVSAPPIRQDSPSSIDTAPQRPYYPK